MTSLLKLVFFLDASLKTSFTVAQWNADIVRHTVLEITPNQQLLGEQQ